MAPGFQKFDVLLLAGLALIVFLLSGPVLLIPMHIPLSYNEGWNAYFAQRAVEPRVGPLYPPANSLVFNNYPPLSFYLVGALGHYVVGDIIIAGRIVALASLLASAVLLGICVRRLGGTVRASLAASMLLMLFSCTAFRDYVAIDDPQWLAHALMLGGLTVLLGSREATRPTVGRAVAAALLVTAGGFVKHNLIGLPLAVTGWLLLTWPRAAAAWLAGACAGVAGGAITTLMLHGQVAFVDILEHRRIVLASRAPKAIGRLLPLLPMLLIAGAARRWHPRRDRPMLFASLFVVISLAAAILQRLGEGVNYNAYFETLIALCLTTGLVISRLSDLLRPSRYPGAIQGAVILFAVLPLLLTMPRHLSGAWSDLDGRAARARSWEPVMARINASPGLVACEELSLCFWASRPFAFDQFNLNQSLLLGAPTTRLDSIIRAHKFRLVEYDGSLLEGARTAEALKHDPLLRELLSAGYAPVSGGPGGIVLLQPGS